MPYDIFFVNLGIKIQHLQNHIDVFGFSIAFYGIIIGIGMLIGLKMTVMEAKRTGQDPELYMDFVLYAIFFAILGARIYYVIFSWDSYKDDLIQVFNIRAGGLAIYGGIIAAAITLYIFSKIKKVKFLTMADTTVLGLVTGQIIGRWGNFFNAEAFGGYTNNIFAMQIRKDIVNSNMLNKDVLNHIIQVGNTSYIQVHPTFLYESMWNLALLIFMLWYRSRKRFEGELFFIYLGGYGLGRALIESLRTDSLLLPGTNFAVSQLLACACILASVLGIYLKTTFKKSASK